MRLQDAIALKNRWALGVVGRNGDADEAENVRRQKVRQRLNNFVN